MRTDLIVAVIVAVFASTGFWTLINTIYQNNAKSKTAERAALVALLHDRIYGLSQEYIERGYVTIEEYDNLNYLWEPYKDLGGNGTAPQVGQYVPGKIYTLQSDLYVRDKPEGAKLKFDALTQDGKRNGFFDAEGCAILRKGTRITCKAVSGNWMMIPSGWICIKNSKGTYII